MGSGLSHSEHTFRCLVHPARGAGCTPQEGDCGCVFGYGSGHRERRAHVLCHHFQHGHSCSQVERGGLPGHSPRESRQQLRLVRLSTSPGDRPVSPRPPWQRRPNTPAPQEQQPSGWLPSGRDPGGSRSKPFPHHSGDGLLLMPDPRSSAGSPAAPNYSLSPTLHSSSSSLHSPGCPIESHGAHRTVTKDSLVLLHEFCL